MTEANIYCKQQTDSDSQYYSYPAYTANRL